MSFILDALKKSESERHRHSGPVLMDVRIAPPRRRLPTWAWIIVAVLAINLLVLAWLLWLSPQREPAQPVAVPAPAAAPTATPAATITAPAQAPPEAAPATVLPEPALPAVTAQPQAATPPLATGPAAPVPVINVAALPRYQDLASAGVTLPSLQLSLHVHDPVPANRYVLLNGTRVREGETLPDGLKILQIVPSGVALEWRGQRFFLNAGG